MKRLSQQKRNQLILTGLALVAVVAGLWFLLIRNQQEGLRKLNEQKTKTQGELARIQSTRKNSAQIEAELLVVSNKLALAEVAMATGDFYSSMVSAIKKFKQAYRVEIPQFNNPGNNAVDVNLLPKFPYKQFTVAISGSGGFYDLGKFIADFENEYPSSRILNLEITPASAQNSEEREKLTFRMDIVSLTTSNAASVTDKP